MTAGKTPPSAHGWPWLPFVDLALVMAVVPGFLLGGLMASAPALGVPAAAWYAAARQAHGHAQLFGLGGAMILGVGLHFLPRLRGAEAPAPRRVRPWFGAFALGLSLRVAAQPLAALAAARPGGEGWARVLGLLFQVGALLEFAAVAGLLAQLVTVLRSGPPLRQKRAFAAVVPFLVAAAGGLLAAVASWTLGSLSAGAAGAGAAGEGAAGVLIPGRWDLPAVHAAVLGLVPAVSVGMSVRLFPLYLRLPTARPAWTPVAAVLFVAAALFQAVSVAAGPGAWTHGAGVFCGGAGLLAGAVAVRVFERRKPFPGDQGRYRAWSDPVAVGAVTAYGWGVLGAVAAMVYGLSLLMPASGLPRVSLDLVVHSLGAGFMTQLIIAVGAVLLPGFGGGRPGSRSLLWAAVAAANLAALLRVLPQGAALWGAAGEWSLAVMGWAGAAGAAAAILFTAYLRSSWPAPAARPAGLRRG